MGRKAVDTDFIPVTINRKKRRLRYCRRSLKLAKMQGISQDEVWQRLGFSQNGKSTEEDDMVDGWLWFGLLVDEPDVTIEQLQTDLLLDEIEGAVNAVAKAQDIHMRKFTGGESLGEPKKKTEGST